MGPNRANNMMQAIILEHDTRDPLESSGAIIMEQYTRKAKQSDELLARAKAFGDSYGRVWIANIDFITPLEQVGEKDMKPQVTVPFEIINEVKEKLGKDLLAKLPFELVDDIPF